MRASTPAPAGVAAQTPDCEAVREELRLVLASHVFAGADRLRHLLSFVVEQALDGAAGQLKEAVIAVEVFKREGGFDSRLDSVVRVQAYNLRAKLDEYYSSEGQGDPVLIELPKGHYAPIFRATVSARGSRAAARIRLWKPATAIVAALIAGVGVYWTVSAWRHDTASSIAVLPFMNLSGARESEYFSDGFVDELTTALAQTGGLRVAARTSAFQFRGRNLDIRSVGRQLGVNTVLEGSVRTDGGKVHIGVQLIKVSDGFHLWSHSYDAEIKNIFAVYEEITRGIARALKLTGPVQLAAARTPRDLEAYDLYLKGQYFKERITAADLQTSVQYLEEAVRKDPSFAPAFAALGDVYATMAYEAGVPDPDIIANAKAAAIRALELDEALAEAHAVLAWIGCFYDWNWRDSEQGLKHALELNPNSSRAHDWYSRLLLSQGRFDEAVSEARRALLLDPLNYRLSTTLCVILYCAHRYPEAIRQARQALEINPHFYKAHTMLGASFAAQNLYGEAEVELTTALNEYPDDHDSLAHMAAVKARLGQKDAALKLLAPLNDPPEDHYELAFWYTVLGDKSRAFEALQKAFEQRTSDMIFVKVDPVFDSLHMAPEFKALEAKMGWNRDFP